MIDLGRIQKELKEIGVPVDVGLHGSGKHLRHTARADGAVRLAPNPCAAPPAPTMQTRTRRRA